MSAERDTSGARPLLRSQYVKLTITSQTNMSVLIHIMSLCLGNGCILDDNRDNVNGMANMRPSVT